jgi:CheY-like chemotaxis protein
MNDCPILVIDDEPAVVAFVRAALERSGYSVHSVTSGVEALEALERGNFCGVISDMRTPGGVTGADVHAWLAAHRRELIGRIIFITGDIVNEETRRLLGATGAPCIEKPFGVQQLLSVVQQVFGNHESQLEVDDATNAAPATHGSMEPRRTFVHSMREK